MHTHVHVHGKVTQSGTRTHLAPGRAGASGRRQSPPHAATGKAQGWWQIRGPWGSPGPLVGGVSSREGWVPRGGQLWACRWAPPPRPCPPSLGSGGLSQGSVLFTLSDSISGRGASPVFDELLRRHLLPPALVATDRSRVNTPPRGLRPSSRKPPTRAVRLGDLADEAAGEAAGHPHLGTQVRAPGNSGGGTKTGNAALETVKIPAKPTRRERGEVAGEAAGGVAARTPETTPLRAEHRPPSARSAPVGVPGPGLLQPPRSAQARAGASGRPSDPVTDPLCQVNDVLPP